LQNLGRWLLVGVCGTFLGIASVALAVRFIGGAAFVENGPWRTSLATGSTEAGPYLRLVIASGGLLALNRSEAIYFFADTDSDGDRLSGACSYQIAGDLPESRWWSLTAYGPDHYMIPNSQQRYSASPANSAHNTNRRMAVLVGPEILADRLDGDWIPSGQAEYFQLTLRLYKPTAAVVADPAAISLPTIVKEGC